MVSSRISMSAETLASSSESRSIMLADGSHVWFTQVGKGAALLMLHGVGGNSQAWTPIMPMLATQRRVIAWSAPGYGGSTPFAAIEPTVDDYADAALRLLDALGLEKADVLGHSMGGLIGARLASMAPNRVGRLVLADCSSGHRGYDQEKRAQILATRMSQDTSDPEAYARVRAPRLLSANARPEHLVQAIEVLSKLQQPGFGQGARMVSNSDIFEFAAQVRADTAVLCGTEDGITPEALNRKIAQAIAGASYWPIEGAGHWSFLEQPAAFARLVLGHLQKS